MTSSENFTGSNPKCFQNLCSFGEIGITYNNQKIKGKLDSRGFPCMFIGYTYDHVSNVYVFFHLNKQAIFMSHNFVWLHKLFHQHMNTKSALIPGFTAYDVTPTNEPTVTVPPAVAPIIAPAPIPQRLTRATAPWAFTFPNVTSSSASEESDDDDDDDDDDDGHPVPPHTTHAPFDMTDTNALLTPRLPRELSNLETFYNPKPGDQGNIALLTQSNDVVDDEMLAHPYKNLLKTLR
jgi:hypothetical protein